MTKKIGLAIHCHHDILVEYCYDYDGRVAYIKEEKLESEQEIRLRVFKILPKEAEKDIPKRYLKADAEWKKAYAEWKKATAEREKADAEWKKAYAERKKAYAEWTQEDKDAFHKKWCVSNCPWDGTKLVFGK